MSVITIARRIDVAAGAEGTTTLYTVKSAQKLTLKRVYVQCSTGSELQLGVAVKKGIIQAVPETGLIRDDGAGVEAQDDTVFVSGEDVSLYYKNEDATNAHSVFVLIEGVIET